MKRCSSCRKLKLILLFNNPFPEEIIVDYHHINNILAVPLPRITHQSGYGYRHKEKIEFKIKGYELIERETYYQDKKMKHPVIGVPEHWEQSVVALVRLD